MSFVYPAVPSYLATSKILPKQETGTAESNEQLAPSQLICSPSYFVDEGLKIDLLNKNALVAEPYDRLSYPDLPEAVEHYQELIPLELPKTEASLFGYQTSMYKVTNTKNGIKYCLRRIHG